MICATKPTLQELACLPRRSFSRRRQVKDPARLKWHEVAKVTVNAMTRPMQVREDEAPYGNMQDLT